LFVLNRLKQTFVVLFVFIEQIAPPKPPTKDQLAAQEYAALSPLARRKVDAEKKKSKVSHSRSRINGA